MKCNKCGQTLPEDSEFCQYCGGKIRPVSSRSGISVMANSITYNNVEKQNQRNTSIALSTVSISCIILFDILMIICLNIKDFYSDTDVLYIMPIVSSILSGLLVLINFKQNTSSSILLIFSCLISLGTFIPFLTDIWDDGEYETVILVLLAISFICYLVNFIVQLYLTASKITKNYHRTASYKMKCYEKLDKMNILKEKGVISEDEFIKFKQQIIDKTI